MTREVWRCPSCAYRYDSPIGVVSVRCPAEHRDKRGAAQTVMCERVWRRGDGPMPEAEEEGVA